MPIVRIDTQWLYFAHVPKCAGSAVEDYLVARFGPVGFLNRRFRKSPVRQRWSKSSPQHIDADTLAQIFPADFFDLQFAVVRHPVDRLTSVFRFQRDIERSFPKKTTFAGWLDDLPERMVHNPYYLDNHVRPMSDMVPDAAEVFQLENGLDQVIAWLDTVAGNGDGPRAVKRSNSYKQRLEQFKRKAGPVPRITARARKKIAALYAADFERFGYERAAG